MSKRKRLVLGLLLSSGISLLAYRRRSLSRSGVVGAITTGTAIFGLGGLAWGLSLIYFFGSSSFFSHYRERDKAVTAADKFSKGGRRDVAQVVANGGVATLLAIGNAMVPPSSLGEVLEAGYVGALATATADTWATELGVLSNRAPRLITSGKKTLPGTSGGVTLLGTVAAAGGALSLGMVFRLVSRRCRSWALLPVALVSGLMGCFFDSLLGATWQAMYYCPLCEKETEQRTHSCGSATRPLRGLSWMDNDVVNFLATFVGSVLGIVTRWSLMTLSPGYWSAHAKAKRGCHGMG